jgi:hypothetical protein
LRWHPTVGYWGEPGFLPRVLNMPDRMRYAWRSLTGPALWQPGIAAARLG